MNTLNPRLVPCLANSINKSVPRSSSFPRSRKSRLSCLSWTPGSYATNFRNTTGALSLQIIVWLLLTLAVPRLADSSPSGSQSAVPAATKQKLAKVQIPFIANGGEADSDVKFYARTFAGTVLITDSGALVYSLPKFAGRKRVGGVALKEELVGGTITEIKGESEAVTKLNVFKGNDRSKWKSNVSTYNFVNLGEVYEGVEVKLKAYGNNVEKLFYVKPGAKPDSIRILVSGGEIRVNENGELEIKTEQGPVRFSKPVAFQEGGGNKEFVEVAYWTAGNEYGFQVKDHDRSKELIIDPILAATFLGGSEFDVPLALALDSQGNVYVAGVTDSPDFPGIGPRSADSTFEVGESFVVKLNSDLSSILAATFLGGSAFFDSVSALALDSQGNVYVAGVTGSPDFPGIGPRSADSTLGFREGFVAKLNSDLSSILAATFIGGSENDLLLALALDSQGNVYVAGVTESPDFPGIGPRSADRTFEAGESFVAKLNLDLSSILAATFLGGAGGDGAGALTLDMKGNVYVAGGTGSPDFPGIGPGSADSTFEGEGFVAKLNSDLSSILAATFLGGAGGDGAGALTLDSQGNVYVAGETGSPDFPGIGPRSADSTLGFREGFVAKLDPNLSSGAEIINDQVSFVVQNTFFNPEPVDGGPAGTFTVVAVLTNKSTENIGETINAVVRTLTKGNRLLSATAGNGGVGSLQAIDAGNDNILAPEESAAVEFRIGLASRNRFSFFVDVFGIRNVDD